MDILMFLSYNYIAEVGDYVVYIVLEFYVADNNNLLWEIVIGKY